MAITLTEHHTCSQLKQRYQSCSHPVEKTHWWIIWRLSVGRQTVAEIAEEAGVGSQWVYKLKTRYNRHGAEGLRDLRQDNGADPLLDEAAVQALLRALKEPPEDGGLWSGPKVARWMAGWLQRPVVPQVGWQYLRKLGWSWKTPRPKHAQSATDAEKAAYKKTPRGPRRAGRPASRKKGRAVGRG